MSTTQQQLQTAGERSITAQDQAQLIQLLIHDLAQMQSQIDAQAQQIQYLTAQVSPAARRRQKSIPHANVAPMHPVEELVDEALLLNELSDSDTTFDSMEEYLQRPRVRPDEIELTAQDRKRIRQPRGMTKIDDSISARFSSQRRESQRAAAGKGGQAWSPTAIMLVIALAIITMMMLSALL